jgi:hypothetical protein
MRKLLYFAVAALFLVLDWSAGAAAQSKKKAPARKTTAGKSTAKKSTATKSTARKAPARKTTARKTPARKSTTRKTTARRRTTSKRRTTWRNRQMSPTPERYKEIQEALVAKGYLNPDDANGTWGSSSVDALKRFQAEQNIEASGKLNSLSLIALGLGPKREPLPAPAVPPADPRPEPARDN